MSSDLSGRELLTGSVRSVLPLSLPWSQGFYLCCQEVLFSLAFFPIASWLVNVLRTDPEFHSTVLPLC
jgi:hypothetical protein